MLLLVLILVVIAFGLLVVALLSSSVLWAWVSVGVSVVAAVVLLIDWLQRRAAVKAGAAPAVEPAAGGPAPLVSPPMGFQPGMGRAPMGDMDPATEVLPIVPSSPRGGDETVAAQAPEQPGSTVSDAQQTVVMPAVQPSGSPARPSGADTSVTSSSAKSSPTVTNGGDDRSEPGFGTGDAGAGDAAAVASGSEDDQPAEKTPSFEKAPSLQKAPASQDGGPQKDGLQKDGPQKAGLQKDGAQPDGAQKDSAQEDSARKDEPAQGTASGSVEAHDGKAGSADAEDQGNGPADPTGGTTASAGSGPASATGPDVESTVKVEAHTKAPAEPTVSVPAASATAPEEVDLFGAPPVRPPAEEAPAAQTPAAQTPPVQTPAAQAPPPPAPIEEAPEEPRDPVAAELVSTLEDEVVVVDEQPRYHVTDCRALVAVAVIPLPVREAVELGFTPCGWCSPDRTLAGRHQTASR